MKNAIAQNRQLIGENISAIRRVRGMKLETVALGMDVSKSKISKIENGQYTNLSIEFLMELAVYFEVNLEELFKGIVLPPHT